MGEGEQAAAVFLRSVCCVEWSVSVVGGRRWDSFRPRKTARKGREIIQDNRLDCQSL